MNPRATRGSRSDTANGQAPRRQANACLRCYEKKVKCDMDSVGQPCTGCVTAGIECQKRSRKPYPPRKDTSTPTSASEAPPPPAPTAINQSEKLPTPPRSVPSESLPTPLFNPEPFDFSLGFQDGAAHMSSSAPTTCEDATMTGTMPFFSGDPQGYGYILDICNAERDWTAQHYFIPQATVDTLDPESLSYAEAKGCFSLPSQALCEELVKCYFHFVHSTLPIVDAEDFLSQYTQGYQNPSLLLLWSMFSVAANFVTNHYVAQSGCKTRQEFKKSLYSKAKCLYDIGYEQDKITLIQSSLLLSFWYSDLQDNAQSWHWTGVAISMAHAIGLHRNPDSRNINSSISSARRRLWSNIWWSCFFRDRWLSFGYGRPLRINADDCDVPMPSSDCMSGPERLPQPWRKYLPNELSQLVPIWLGLLQLTVVLGDILTANYQPRRSAMDPNTLDQLDRRISECLPEKQAPPMYSELVQFFDSYARLHVESATIALYRPFASEFVTSSRIMGSNSVLSPTADIKIRSAATRASCVLDRIVATDTLRFAGPMMVPLLVPAMTIHLLQARSHDHFTSSWSKNRLELSLLVLKRLEENYPAASLVYELFAHAQDRNSLPFGISRPGSTSYLTRTASNYSSPWSEISRDSFSNPMASSGLNGWTSPDLGPGMELWNMTPPEKLFFPFDDLMSRL
ncbi:hypothetical protein PRZ48_010425 [Zasmidium cellare]|uniref:Zn(2)-C6 fungal-type domain-containing protein n=1 Tax=Zasmidium cellare TaxID=395010 RepID=A0ABR0E8L2_ZASCE|nr:hypothetical protein PRZ48_010425 [Zasmidium cellare]